MPSVICILLVSGAALCAGPSSAAEGAASVSKPEELPGRRPADASVSVVRIDGRTLQGRWAGCPDGEAVRIETDEGVQMLALNGLQRITRADSHRREGAAPGAAISREDHATPSRKQRAAAVFYSADGGRLYGSLDRSLTERESGRRSEDNNVSDVIYATTALGARLPFRFEHLAAVRLGHPDADPDAHALFEEAHSARLAAKDVLITKGTGDLQATAVRGLLASLNAEHGEFAFGGRVRTFQTEKVYGVVFAAGAIVDSPKPPLDGVTISLRDGSDFSGRLQPLPACGSEESGTHRDDTICVASSLGPMVAVMWGDVRALQIHSDRIVYVSAMEPIRQEVEGIVHRTVLGRTCWPVGQDRSATGGPLSLGGHHFKHGLGVHSRTELVYPLDAGFEAFVASIGIDDAVRPQGNVVFRVIGDEKLLFDSGVVTGQDQPRDIVVDVKGVQMLTLVVDYGEDLDVGDAAVWGGARLLKPAS